MSGFLEHYHLQKHHVPPRQTGEAIAVRSTKGMQARYTCRMFWTFQATLDRSEHSRYVTPEQGYSIAPETGEGLTAEHYLRVRWFR